MSRFSECSSALRTYLRETKAALGEFPLGLVASCQAQSHPRLTARTCAQSLHYYLTLSRNCTHLHTWFAGGATAHEESGSSKYLVCLPNSPGGLSVTTCNSTAQPEGPDPAPGPVPRSSSLRHRSPACGLSDPDPGAAALLAKLKSFQKP